MRVGHGPVRFVGDVFKRDFRGFAQDLGSVLGQAKSLEDIRRQLFRMTSEIRYAEKLLMFSDKTIEFTTRYLEDNNEDIETIKYEWPGSPSRILNRYGMGHRYFHARFRISYFYEIDRL